MGKGKLMPKGKMENKSKGKLPKWKYPFMMKKPAQMGKGKLKPKGKMGKKPKGKIAKGKIKAKPKGKIKTKPKGKIKTKPKGKIKTKPKGKIKTKPKGKKPSRKRKGRSPVDGEEPILVVKRASVNNIIAGTAKEK